MFWSVAFSFTWSYEDFKAQKYLTDDSTKQNIHHQMYCRYFLFFSSHPWLWDRHRRLPWMVLSSGYTTLCDKHIKGGCPRARCITQQQLQTIYHEEVEAAFLPYVLHTITGIILTHRQTAKMFRTSSRTIWVYFVLSYIFFLLSIMLKPFRWVTKLIEPQSEDSYLWHMKLHILPEHIKLRHIWLPLGVRCTP